MYLNNSIVNRVYLTQAGRCCPSRLVDAESAGCTHGYSYPVHNVPWAIYQKQRRLLYAWNISSSKTSVLETETCLVMHERKINWLASAIALVPACMTWISYVACVTVFAAIVNASGSREELGALCQHLGDCLGKPVSAQVEWLDKQTWADNGLILASLWSAMPWNNLFSDSLDGTSDTLRHALFCSRSPRSELVMHRNRLFDNNFIYRLPKLIWFCLWVYEGVGAKTSFAKLFSA